MPATATRRQNRQQLATGPWKGVRDTTEPFDDAPEYLVDATNIYIPDPEGASAAFARSGFSLMNSGNAVYSGKGQCVYTHIAVDSTVYPFIVGGGRLYRVDSALAVFTDVTPVGVTIDPVARVKIVSLGDVMIVSDSVNAPWIGTNLGGTPITGTYIDYDGAGVLWSAQDITVWGGSIIAILKQVAGIARQSDISWSEPGTPDIGWQQLDFDNNWTLEQTGSSPLFAIVGTNVALYYFRNRSIGSISGTIGPDLQTTSTQDSISFNVGTRTPQSIQTFGNYIYFCDAMGRPWRMALGQKPEAIWLNMRAQVENQATSYPAVTDYVTVSAFEPALNLYLAAIWSQNPAQLTPPAQMYQFDARSGSYVGRWNIKGPNSTSIEAMGSLVDGLSHARLVVLGSKLSAPAPGGFAWALNSNSGLDVQHIASEGTSPPGPIIATEGGLRLTVEGQQVGWTDDGQLPDISVTTARLGYSQDVMWIVDRCTVITGSPDPCSIAMRSSAFTSSIVAIPTPGLSADDTYRLVAGCRVIGRGTQVQVRPLQATTQWSADRVSIIAAPSQARPEDA